MFSLSSANAFTLVTFTILSFGKELGNKTPAMRPYRPYRQFNLGKAQRDHFNVSSFDFHVCFIEYWYSKFPFLHTFLLIKILLRYNPFPYKPWFLCVCSTSILKTLLEKEKLLIMSNYPFPSVFSTCSVYFVPFSSNMKLSSAKSSSLEESKICCMGKG